jgi:hypothetical protein
VSSKPRVLIVSLTDKVRFDARLDRQIGFLLDRYEVVTAGLAHSRYEELELIDLSPPSQARRVGELARRGRSLARLLARRYHSAYWSHPVNTRALARLAGHGADVIFAMDVSALPLACEIAGASPVILDAYEYAPEEQSELLWWRLIMRPYTDYLLRAYLPRVAAMTTVGEGVAERYESVYGVRPVVVTNAPASADLSPTPVGDPIRLVHHGMADPKRSQELMIEAIDLLGAGFTLDLMLVPGDRRYLARLREMAAERPGVRVIEPVGPRDIARRLNGYDVGVHLLPTRCLNHELALPNKLFDFIQARLAVAIGPSPEMARVVRAHDCGVVAEDHSPASFARALRGLTPDRIAALKLGSHRAARELTAERNRDVVLEMVWGVLWRQSSHAKPPATV